MDRRSEDYINRIWDCCEKSLQGAGSVRRRQWQAFGKRFWEVPWSEKVRLLGKLAARIVGIHKCFFLGGYRWEEDVSQQIQDVMTYLALWRRRAGGCMEDGPHGMRRQTAAADLEPSAAEEAVLMRAVPEEAQTRDSLSELRGLAAREGSHIAMLVETLDRGGLENVVRTLAVGYVSRGIPVKVFCVKTGGAVAEELADGGIPIVELHGSRQELEDYLRRDRPLLVNTHFVADYMEIFAAYGIPVVDVIHNMYVFLTNDRLKQERRRSSLVTEYIAVSEAAAHIFAAKVLNGNCERMTVVGNVPGIAPEAVSGNTPGAVVGSGLSGIVPESLSRAAPGTIAEMRQKVRRKWNIPQDSLVYLSAGNICARKNQLGLLRAWDVSLHLTDRPMVLVIAGAGSEPEYERKVARLIEERSLSESVILTGHCGEMQKLMTAADFFLMDSYYEGWSMAATEALLCGLPVIHSDCGSGRELVAGGRNGILVENPIGDIASYDSIALYDMMHAGHNENIEQLAGAILRMQWEAEKWERKREEIAGSARDSFSAEKMFERYSAVFLKAYKEKEKRKGQER